MKRIIDNKVYNTETATKVGSYSNFLGPSDFNFINETLYITKKGNWFLEYCGGARTRYCKPVGNMTGGGEGILVLSEDEAYDFLEEHHLTEAIQKHFEHRIEEA